jgi:hypothetical protein
MVMTPMMASVSMITIMILTPMMTVIAVTWISMMFGVMIRLHDHNRFGMMFGIMVTRMR